MFHDRLVRQIVAMAGVAALVAGCGGSADTVMTSTTNGSEVQALASLAFSPSTITIATGGTVTWAFGSVGHTVTFDGVDGAPASITGTNANVSIARTFATTGVYTYHCSIHPSMTGTVIVGSSNVTPPPPPPPPPPPAGYLKVPQ